MWQSQHLAEELARDRISERTTPTHRFPRSGRPARLVRSRQRNQRKGE